MANPHVKPWKKSWAVRRSTSSCRRYRCYWASLKPSPLIIIHCRINIVICALEFAPQKGIAVDPTTHSALVFGVVPRHLQLTPPMLETSSVFSTTSELFARSCSARPLFSTICGLFCQNQGGALGLDFSVRGCRSPECRPQGRTSGESRFRERSSS